MVKALDQLSLHSRWMDTKDLDGSRDPTNVIHGRHNPSTKGLVNSGDSLSQASSERAS